MGLEHKQFHQCRDIHADRVQHAATANSVKAKSRTFTVYNEELENIEVF